jgi:hypothetical protein
MLDHKEAYFLKGDRLLICAPGRAHSLGGESPLRTLMTGTVSRTARAVTVRWGLKEAVSKSLA